MGFLARVLSSPFPFPPFFLCSRSNFRAITRLETLATRASPTFVTTLNTSSETQVRSVGPGEKARQKFSSTGGKAPGYRLSPDHFQTDKRMLAPDWAQKMLCIIVPNRRTASPEFFSRVRKRRLLIRSRLLHQRNTYTQSGIFQFNINATFQNTGSLYTRA